MHSNFGRSKENIRRRNTLDSSIVSRPSMSPKVLRRTTQGLYFYPYHNGQNKLPPRGLLYFQWVLALVKSVIRVVLFGTPLNHYQDFVLSHIPMETFFGEMMCENLELTPKSLYDIGKHLARVLKPRYRYRVDIN